MQSLRKSNPYLTKRTDAEIRGQLEQRAYESSVFEGLRLPRDHRIVALSKASRKKSASGSGTESSLNAAQAEAAKSGASELSMDEINAEIAAYRKEYRGETAAQ